MVNWLDSRLWPSWQLFPGYFNMAEKETEGRGEGGRRGRRGRREEGKEGKGDVGGGEGRRTTVRGKSALL